MFCFRIISFFSVVSLGSGALLAQGHTGQISGNVADASGGVIASADVRIVNTGQTRSTRTNANGHFIITELLPGAGPKDVPKFDPLRDYPRSRYNDITA